MSDYTSERLIRTGLRTERESVYWSEFAEDLKDPEYRDTYLAQQSKLTIYRALLDHKTEFGLERPISPEWLRVWAESQ